jgi:hypothetical protein
MNLREKYYKGMNQFQLAHDSPRMEFCIHSDSFHEGRDFLNITINMEYKNKTVRHFTQSTIHKHFSLYDVAKGKILAPFTNRTLDVQP